MGRKAKEPIYEDVVELWQCSCCRNWLPSSEYYGDRRTLNGLKAQCKDCHNEGNVRTRNQTTKNKSNREYMRRERLNNIETIRERERIAARKRPKDIRYYSRIILNMAVMGGIIQKPKVCERCGKKRKITGHHHDYYKPFEVEWLCYECHGNK